MHSNRLFPILLLLLLAAPAVGGSGGAVGVRWWETIGTPTDHHAQEVAPGTGVEHALRTLRSGEGSSAGDLPVPASATRDPLLRFGAGRDDLPAAGWVAPVRPLAERLPYHAIAPPTTA